MRRLMKRGHRGEKGFTLIELLIVIAILGIIAAVVIPNAAGFLATGTLNAANTEVANVKTAATGFMAEKEGMWPETSDDLGDYFEGGTAALKALYTFGIPGGADNDGLTADPVTTNVSTIKTVAGPAVTKPWTGICWDGDAQQWKRGTEGQAIALCP